MIHLSAFADEIDPDPVKQLDVLEEHGIRHIEFRSIFGTNVLDLTDDQHESFRSLLRDRGFALSAIGSPIGKIQIGDDFEPHLRRYDRAIQLAEFYETPRIRIFSYYLPREDAPAKFRDEVLNRMAIKARIAESKGITLFLENERYIYGDNADRVLDLMETIHSPALSHAFDPANYLEVGQPIDDAWAKLKTKTTHFHVKDFKLADRTFVPTGEGDGQIPELIADAVSSGFSGFCVLEPHLLVSELTFGFTGPERFGDAARALKGALDSKGIAYD